MIYANTPCAQVSDGAVEATGPFAVMIAPASPFREGMPEDRAKTEFGVYRIGKPALINPARFALVEAAPYYDSDADAVFNATLSARTLEDRRADLRGAVNAERDRRWRGAVDVVFADSGSDPVTVPVDTRDDTDLRNIQAVTTTAQILAANPAATIDFRGADDVTYNLTPTQIITLGLTVSAHVNGFYAAAWDLKDLIAAAASHDDLDAIDPVADQHWPAS